MTCNGRAGHRVIVALKFTAEVLGWIVMMWAVGVGIRKVEMLLGWSR